MASFISVRMLESLGRVGNIFHLHPRKDPFTVTTPDQRTTISGEWSPLPLTRVLRSLSFITLIYVVRLITRLCASDLFVGIVSDTHANKCSLYTIEEAPPFFLVSTHLRCGFGHSCIEGVGFGTRYLHPDHRVRDRSERPEWPR